MRNIEIDKARVFLYNILSLLFVEEYVKNSPQKIVENLEILSNNAFDEDVSLACKKIIESLNKTGLDRLYIDYQELFIVPFGEYVSLSASWYHEQRCLEIIYNELNELFCDCKIRKDEKFFTAPEDHYGFIFTLSPYLIEQQINEEIKEDLQKEKFKDVINLYCDELFYKLIGCSSPIYSQVGVILANICNFERAYLEVAKPKN